MAKPPTFNPIERVVINGGVFVEKWHLRHDLLKGYEGLAVQLDSNFDVDRECITSFSVYDNSGYEICELDFPPKGEDDVSGSY